MANEAKSNIKVVGVNLILSYPNLEEPRADDFGKPWYSATLITVPPGFTVNGQPVVSNTAELKAAVIEAAMAHFKVNKERAVEMFKDGELKSPFRRDVKKKGYPEGSEFFSCKSKQKPGIVGLAPGKDGKPAIYTGEIYPGLLVKASLRPYYFKQQGGGIAMGLGNLQVLGPSGLRFDSRIGAEDEFEADANAAAAAAGDMSDLF